VRTRFGLRQAISTVLGAFAGALSVATGYQGECGVRTPTLSVAAGQESTGTASIGSSADK